MVGNRNKGNDRDAYISIKYNSTAWQQRLRTSEADEKMSRNSVDSQKLTNYLSGIDSDEGLNLTVNAKIQQRMGRNPVLQC